MAEECIPAVVFKTEDSLWQMVVSGEKNFDFRRYNLADDRIYRLSFFEKRPGGGHEPVNKSVSFLNKATGEVATLEYCSMEFMSWAPNWCCLVLGKLLSITYPDGHIEQWVYRVGDGIIKQLISDKDP